jgi:saccharopine dehydrogenase-like NADP-dependent oxidoreductase
MKQILILGAGKIAHPLLRYLLNFRGYRLTIGTLDVPRARELLDDHPRGCVLPLDVNDRSALEPLVKDCDVVVSLLPASFNPGLARLALTHGRSLINTSYTAPEMRALDEEARSRGVLLLNEIGLDPGVDHMSAVRVIHRLEAAGGRVTHFTSCCGGFPAPDANTNPWGYKFSWTHRGVILAGRNPARYLRQGELVEISGAELFEHHWPYQVEGQGVFEMYPNRDSLHYVVPYGLSSIQGMFRGTLRYPGWSNTMRAAGVLGMFELEEQDWPEGTTYLDFTTRLLPPGRGSVIERLADHLGLSPDSFAIARLEWAGLLSDRPIPERRAAPLDVFANRLAMLMVYAPGERDMIAMRHTFRATYPDGHTDDVTSSMVETGEPFGDTAMARTVSLPAAIATRLYLEGEIEAEGVQIPTIREVYDPVLEELAELGVEVRETVTTTYPGPLS